MIPSAIQKKASRGRFPSLLILLAISATIVIIAGAITVVSISSTGSNQSGRVLVRIAPFGSYTPQQLTVVIGINNTVTWTNGDIVGHSVTSDSGLFDSGILGFNQQWSFTFAQPGTYHYHCSVHELMVGSVTVLS